jgi:hypothetical protein
MSNIIKLLKEAYEKKDWGVISIIHENLTGETLSDIESSTFQPRGNVQQPNRQPQTKQPQTGNKSRIIVPGMNPSTPNNKKYARTENVDISKNNINIFVDDGTEAVEDKAIDLKLKNKNPIARNRGADTVDIMCSGCGNVFCVNTTLVSKKGYICDSCITRKR